MIITCGECATQFQLDEARVPESGIRVRCSVCKHAFFVGPPDALDDAEVDPVARVVSEVLDAEPHGVPAATEDLAAPVAGTLGDVAPDGGGEERWEFSDEGRLSDASGTEPRDRFEESFEKARAAVDDLLGAPWRAPSAPSPAPAADSPTLPEALPWDELTATPAEEPAQADDDLADDPWDTPAWSDEATGSDPVGPDEAAGPGLTSPDEAAGPDLTGPDDAAGPDPIEFANEEPDGEEGIPLGDAFSDPVGPPMAPDRASAEPAKEEALEFDSPDDSLEEGPLGEALDEFDAAGEDAELDVELGDVPDPDAAPDPPASGSESWAEGDFADLDSGWGDADEIADPAPVGPVAETPAPVAFARAREPGRASKTLRAWGARAGSAMGWGAVCLLAAVALWASVAPRTQSARATGAQALAGLEAIDVAGRFVEHATLGPLYVVSGSLHNPGAETRTPGARLVVRLLDRDGTPVDEAAASLGRPFGTLALREARPEDLRRIGEAGALELARTPLAPGARIPFEAVVLELPEDAQRFELAAAGR